MTLDQCSLTLVNFILTLENLGPRVNDSWDSDPSENPVDRDVLDIFVQDINCKRIKDGKLKFDVPNLNKNAERGVS